MKRNKASKAAKQQKKGPGNAKNVGLLRLQTQYDLLYLKIVGSLVKEEFSTASKWIQSFELQYWLMTCHTATNVARVTEGKIV